MAMRRSVCFAVTFAVAAANLAGGKANATGSLIGPPQQVWGPNSHNVDLNPEVPISDVITMWPEESTLGLTVECIFAMMWITMVASVPLILPLLDKSPITNTQFTLAWIMWLALFGGVFLFTTIIKFQSAHFSTVRPLTVVECVYLMSQVITTVGYGDITPALPRGQVFVALYVLASMLVIAMLVSDLASHIVGKTQDYEEQLADDIANAKPADLTAADLNAGKPPSVMPLVRAFGSFIIFASIGIFFFHYYPGEEKPWFQATYMSIITLSTVGFGAVLPATEMGKVFGAFWMIFGSAALVSVITAFAELMAQLNEYERKRAERETPSARAQKMDRVSEVEFFKMACVQKGVCNERDLEDLDALFDSLMPDYADLSIDVSDVEQKFASVPAKNLGKMQGDARRKQESGGKV